jgi:diadenosine tetraphosphate (Ap4A) HIT family hydrolase
MLLSFQNVGYLPRSRQSKGGSQSLPDHGEKLTDIPDDHLSDILPIAKKVAAATGVADYNILQNNGRIAHQVS